MGFLSVKKQGVDSFQEFFVCCRITARYEYWMNITEMYLEVEDAL